MSEFDWDPANVGHLERHGVLREEAEQVILNEPLDLGLQVVKGEERYVSLGTTDRGPILIVVTTWRGNSIRVVTAFDPVAKLVRFYYKERGR